MLTYKWSLTSSQQTQRLAMRLSNILLPGDVIAAEGDLGAGKTTFAQGLARGFDIAEPIDSPTFTIIKEYKGSVPFYHMDVYRLDGPEESLSIDEYLEGDGVCYIEWASRIDSLLPPETIWLTFTVQSEGQRRLQLKTSLPRVQQWCEGEQT